jgi:DNA-binding transcriptional ArsR family regulator
VDRIFEALGDPVRRRILEALGAGEQPAGRIVDAVRALAPISQPAVSQHLRVLREAGLVLVRTEGTRRFYAVDPEGMAAARAWLDRFTDPLAPFAQPLDALATELARGRRARRSAAAEESADGTGTSSGSGAGPGSRTGSGTGPEARRSRRA